MVADEFGAPAAADAVRLSTDGPGAFTGGSSGQ
jgi:hypothetical protein